MSESYTSATAHTVVAEVSHAKPLVGLPDIPNDVRIDVEIVDLHTIRLVPKSRLAAEVLRNAAMWGSVGTAFRSPSTAAKAHDPRYLAYVEVSSTREPHGVLAPHVADLAVSGLRLTPAEYAVALEAIRAHREANAPKPKGARARRKGAS